MKNSVFLSFCFFIVTVIVSVHGLVRQGVDPSKAYQHRLEAIEKEKREAEFKAQLAAHELADYQQQIATLLPESSRKKLDDRGGYLLRQVASVIGANDELAIERGSSLMEKAKAAFRKEDFELANSSFQNLIEKYPTSSHVAEAHFLLAEGYFRLGDYDGAVTTIEKMIDIFPENELTGFALLRLGHIFEVKERLEDAGDVYRAVISNFKQSDILKQARISLREVAL